MNTLIWIHVKGVFRKYRGANFDSFVFVKKWQNIKIYIRTGLKRKKKNYILKSYPRGNILQTYFFSFNQTQSLIICEKTIKNYFLNYQESLSIFVY